MSQVRLTLRPPPNVDFIHGYPGIPPSAPERPQAAIKGALEVRVAPAVKAKWVRIELKKIEILPGGGQNNTYYDLVGPSPVNLWVANKGEEYSDLGSLDFPFSIRIPESVPPTLSLDNRAGIKYELLASVCQKGKRAFLRRRKDNVVSTQTPIIIDKHELHSTWPVYCQPETRAITSEGVTLTVERNHTCFGPGDRVSIFATVKPDAMHTIILRGFELSIKEQMMFRPGKQGSGGGISLGGGSKKNAPLVQFHNVCEAKFPVNTTLYGETSHRLELTCQIDPNHTTTTLNSARHIDITYVLCVQALMGTGAHLNMDLPIILSNWQRNVSQEAVRRIGPAPGLTLSPTNASSTDVGGVLSAASAGTSTAPPAQVQTLQQSHTRNQSFSSSSAQPNGGYQSKTAPVGGHKTTGSGNSLDEFGVVRGAGGGGGASSTTLTTSSHPVQQASPPRSNNNTTNLPQYHTAEREKTALQRYHEAVEAVNRNNAAVGGFEPPVSGPAPVTGLGGPVAYDSLFPQQQQQQASSPPPPGGDLPPPFEVGPVSARDARTALEEKRRLKRQYEAQDAAAAKQDNANTSPPPFDAGPVKDARTALEEKMRLKRQYEAQDAAAARQDNAKASPPSFDAGPVAPVPMKDARTALEEKMRLKRLYEAQDAAAARQDNANASPPPFDAGPPVKDARTALEEKMRLKKQYEMQDALARQQQNEIPPYAPPPAFSGSSVTPPSASVEKEMLRRRFEAQQAANSGSPTPPPRKNSSGSINRGARPAPSPPSGSRVMTAAEEKALLRAKYDAEERGTSPKLNGTLHSSSAPSTPPAPPPLAPRPPASYIQETQEEDARVSKFALEGFIPSDEEYLGFSRSPSASSAKSPPGSPPPR